MNRSLKSRLLMGLLASLGLLLAAGSVVIYLLERELRYRQFDRTLHSALPRVLRQVAEGAASSRPREFPGVDFYWVRNEDRGKIIFSYPPDRPPLPVNRMVGYGQPVFFNLTLPGGRSGRAFLERHGPGEAIPPPLRPAFPPEVRPPPPALTVMIAANTAALHAILRSRALIIGVTAAGSMLLITLLVVWVVQRSLRPLRPLMQRISGLRMEHLDEAIQVPGLPAEITPVVDRLNQLLARLNDAFRRERAFTANAAHEFRTPIAAIRSTVEVALSRERTAEGYAQALRKTLEIVIGLQGLIESLLELARLDADQVSLHCEALAIRQVVDRQWQSVSEKAAERRLRLENSIPSDVVCDADRVLLDSVVGNLLDNAVRYADAGGVIRAAGTTAGARARFSITNPARGMTPEVLSTMFDRLWRGDAARTDAGVHAGLGLSLVKRSLEVMGGTVRAELPEEGILSINVELPGVENPGRPTGQSPP